MVCSRGLNH